MNLKTDPEALLACKGEGKDSKFSYSRLFQEAAAFTMPATGRCAVILLGQVIRGKKREAGYQIF